MIHLQRHPLIVLIPAIWLFFFLALTSLIGDSPTMDEQNHIARGLAFLRTGDPRLSLEHPPLVNSLSALPLLSLPAVHLPTDDPSWTALEPAGASWYFFADLLLWQYNHDVTRMVFLARLPVVFMMLGLALVGFRLGQAMWGGMSGAGAFLFLLFDPNLMANGRYATTDLGGTFFMFLATWQLWRMWQRPGWSWGRWIGAVLVLGFAFASKLSILAFALIWLLLALLPVHDTWSFRLTRQRVIQLLTAGAASIVIVWVIFGFEWASFNFASPDLASFNRFSGPMPTFWAGIEQILLLSGGGRTAFLLGKTTTEGFLWYFPIALGVKTPLPVLLLWLGTAVLLLRYPYTRQKALFLLVPPLLFLALTMQSGLNLGYRHLLPMLPFLYVLGSGAVGKGMVPITIRAKWPGVSEKNKSSFNLHWSSLTGGLFVWLLGVNLFIYPHYLSYFNLLAGGPENGGNILIDSNIDWGQDLLRLREWMADNAVERVKLGWFGTAVPSYYGIAYDPLPGLGGVGQPQFFDAWWQLPFDPNQPEPGVYAISVTSLWEFPFTEKTVYAWFRDRQPDDRVGYSILIYEVP